MAQSTILAAGLNAADSTPIVVADAPVSVGIFTPNGSDLALGQGLPLLMLTPGQPNVVTTLVPGGAAVSLSGRGTYIVRRATLPAGSTPLGVYLES